MMADNIKRLFQWRLLEERGVWIRKGLSCADVSSARKELMRFVTGSEEDVVSPETRFPIIAVKWNEIAGPLAKHSRPVGIRGRDLLVCVEKSVYSQEISMYSIQILSQIKKVASVSLDKIRIEVGRIGSSMDGAAKVSATITFPDALKNGRIPGDANKRSVTVKGGGVSDETTDRMLEGLKRIKEEI